MLERIPTHDMAREDWLALRRQSIGGSDAAAIIGLNSWSSPYRVWADKTGRLPEEPDNEAMRQGRDLEDYVAKRWSEETGRTVRRSNYLYRNSDYPFAHANIDRWVGGENAGLECKTTSALSLTQYKNGEYPANYYVQCMHYMAVTGCNRWYLAVLVLNKGFYHFTIERDEAEIAALMGKEAEFWGLVQSDTPPPVDGAEPTGDTLQTIYSESSPGSAIDLFGRDTLIDEYYQQKELRDRVDARMETIKQTLMQDLGTNETGVAGSYKVTWKPQSRSTFDSKKYAADNPGIDLSGYYKTTTFRKFDIKEM